MSYKLRQKMLCLRVQLLLAIELVLRRFMCHENNLLLEVIPFIVSVSASSSSLFNNSSMDTAILKTPQAILNSEMSLMVERVINYLPLGNRFAHQTADFLATVKRLDNQPTFINLLVQSFTTHDPFSQYSLFFFFIISYFFVIDCAASFSKFVSVA